MADCTIIDKLNYILETKDLIKTALETQDVEVLESDTFRKYSEYVTEIRKVASVNGETGDIILKTINGQNLVGEGDIVIQGGGGGSVTAGVNKIIMGEEDYGWNTYTGDVKLTNGWIDLDDDGVQETYDIRVGDNSGSSLWFGFNSTDNSIKIEDNGSRLSFTVNPDILGGNVDLSDYYTKGEVYNKNEVNELIDGVNAGDVDLTNYYTKQEVDDKIPSLDGYATEQWVENKNYLTEHQDLTDYAKKSDIPTIPTSNTAFTNDAGFITINEVPPTDLSDYYTKTETYSKDEVDDLLENSGSGTAGVEAINVGKDAQDWTQKTGVVSFYTDWYDGSYDVAIGGMSFFGVKPIDNSIILENAGGTVNGNTRCGIKINTDNFKTINGESIIGSGNITIEGGSGSGTINIIELTQAEYDALTEYADNTFYVITDANKQYTTLEEVEQQGYLKAIPDTYVTDGELSIAISDKVSQNALNEAIEGVEAKIPSLDGYAKKSDIPDVSKFITGVPAEYITEEELNGKGYLTSIPDIYVTDGELSTAISDKVSQTELTNYYTKSEIDNLIGGVSDKISDINSMI